MLNHVKEVIFVSNEPISLKSLLDDYNNLLTSYNMERITRVTTIEGMLQEEFGDKIGFHERLYNKSMIVCNKSESGTFIDAGLHSFRISDEQFIYNVAKRLHSKYKGMTSLCFTLHEGNQESVRLLVKLLTRLKKPSQKTFEDDPIVSA